MTTAHTLLLLVVGYPLLFPLVLACRPLIAAPDDGGGAS